MIDKNKLADRFKIQRDWAAFDPIIIAEYTKQEHSAVVMNISRATGLAPSTVCSRAKKLGLRRFPGRFNAYSLAEDTLIIRYHAEHPEKIRVRLEKIGRHRTMHAIESRITTLRKRGKLPTVIDHLDDRDYLTVDSIMRIMGVTRHTVMLWIKKEGLPALSHCGPNNKIPRRHLVRRKDLRQWLLTHLGHWDVARCAHYEATEILAGSIPTVIQHSTGIVSDLASGYVEHGVCA